MKNKVLGALASATLLVAAAESAQAATIDPTSFDAIFTEGQRVKTVDLAGAPGADVSGGTPAAGAGNGDVGTADIGPLPAETLLVGRVVSSSDSYTASSVTGMATITVLNYAEASRAGVSPFRATFEVLADGMQLGLTDLASSGAPFEGVDVGTFGFTGEDLTFTVTGVEGASDYDVRISIAAVPLPAAGLLMLGALGGLGVARRRAKT